ncbi:MAG: hypothetical protein JXB08_03190 [Bacilli bacterium]|nr:hypothetical protein [Bacilli bacterium]MBN2876295.1 hypothetical protein [Bacilli bacterium]
MKRVLTVMLFFVVVLLMSGCSNDAGIIKWTYSDDVLDWRDVRGASYYELLFYDENDELFDLMTDTPFYAYSSDYSFAIFPTEYELHLKIVVYFEDGSQKESDFIDLKIDREFDRPKYITSDYLQEELLWMHYFSDSDGFQDYTLMINDEEYTVDTNSFDITSFEDGLYKAKVRANYDGGSSAWTEFYYFQVGFEYQQVSAYYDVTSDTDFTYTFDSEDIIYVTGRLGLTPAHTNLPESIVKVDGSTIIVNKYYIMNTANEEVLTGETPGILIGLMIGVDGWIYNLYILN